MKRRNSMEHRASRGRMLQQAPMLNQQKCAALQKVWVALLNAQMVSLSDTQRGCSAAEEFSTEKDQS
jgi:hypothetical protein